MSRFRRALAATTLAAAAAGGALLTSTGGAAPAYAAVPAAQAPPPGSHTFTLSANLSKQATSGVGPHVILPCAVPGSAGPSQSASTGCVPQTITCWITVPAPAVNSVQIVFGTASVHCDHQVDAIRLDEVLYQNNSEVDSESDDVVNFTDASTLVVTASCQPVDYDNFGFAGVDFPPGYVPVYPGTSLHHLESFTPTASDCAPPPPGGGGGGGGGGGCSVTSPSPSASPAADRPHVIVCP